MTDPSIVAQGYDAVHEAMPRGPTLLRIWRSKTRLGEELVAGNDYPDHFSQISFVTLRDLRELAQAMRLSRGSSFSDVACGMGGPGLLIPRGAGRSAVRRGS